MIMDQCVPYNSSLFFSVVDYVAWKGRFCAFDYSSFERFMAYMFAQVMNREPHVPDPWDTNITIDALGKILGNLGLLPPAYVVAER